MNFLERNPWLITVVLLTAVLGGAALVFWQPPWLMPATLFTVFGIIGLWVAVSAFWPARADRSCPECGEEALVRLEQDSTMGVRCTACEHVDREATSWFLAEEEGVPLEDLVLRQRGRAPHTEDR